MTKPFTLPARVRVRSPKLDKLTLVCSHCPWKYEAGTRPELLHLSAITKNHLRTHEQEKR